MRTLVKIFFGFFVFFSFAFVSFADEISVYPSSDSSNVSIYALDFSAWSNARDATSGTVRTGYVQSTFTAGTYFIERGFFNFDTADILPEDSIVDNVTFSFVVDSSDINDSPSFRLWGSTASDPVVGGDYDAVTDVLISDDFYSSFVDDDRVYFEFNADGLDYLNLAGITKLSVREYEYDYLDISPSDINTLHFLDSSSGSSTSPRLDIEYHVTLDPVLLALIASSSAETASNTAFLVAHTPYYLDFMLPMLVIIFLLVFLIGGIFLTPWFSSIKRYSNIRRT